VYNIATVIDGLIDRVMVDPRLSANPRVDEARHRVSAAGVQVPCYRDCLLGRRRAAIPLRPADGRFPSPPHAKSRAALALRPEPDPDDEGDAVATLLHSVARDLLLIADAARAAAEAARERTV